MQSKKILLTGGGSGGHIFPLLAVADELQKTNYTDIEIFYLGPRSSLNREFLVQNISVYTLASSKLRHYFSLANFVDTLKFPWSLFQALYRLYILMPDVVFSKGGAGALPVTLAARFYFIPIIIHESDSIPGLTNRISSKFAKRIGLGFESAASYFKNKKIFVCGNPVRPGLLQGGEKDSEAKAALGFKKEEPLIFVEGGSQGAARINQFIFDNLEILLKRYQIYHQAGDDNLAETKLITGGILKELPGETRERYHFAGFLDLASMRLALRAADVVISRAGSGSIFEIAIFGKPSILIPIPSEVAGEHQKFNAYEYSKTGAAIVIEEENLKLSIVSIQIDNIFKDNLRYAAMAQAALNFAKPEAAKIIVGEILQLISFDKQ